MKCSRRFLGGKVGRLLLGLALTGMQSGCVVLALGAAGVTGGYAVSADGIEGVSDRKFDELWQTARNVLEQQGAIAFENKEQGRMKAKVGGSEVKVLMEQATQESVVARVQARRTWGLFPDMNLARRIYSMVMYEQKQTAALRAPNKRSLT